MRVIVAFLAFIAVVYSTGEGFASELSNLPFKTLIGGPLTAVIQAQALAAKNTIVIIIFTSSYTS